MSSTLYQFSVAITVMDVLPDGLSPDDIAEDFRNHISAYLVELYKAGFGQVLACEPDIV